MRRLLVLAATALLGLGAAVSGSTVAAYADTSAGTAAPSAGTPSASQIISTAEQYLGYPYAYIGDDPSTGFSCIGFVHFVFAQNGVYVPEDLGKAYASAPHVDQANLQPGDLVFFKDTVWTGISHVDLYVGNGKMIGADSFQTGVQWDTLGDAYWQEHYLGATRPLADPSGTPPDPSATPLPSGPSLAPTTGPSLDIKPGATLATRQSATVYSGPGYIYMAIDTAAPATTMTAVQTHGQWVNVSYHGGSQYGWVFGDDVTAAPADAASGGDSATQTPAATETPTATATPAPTPRVAHTTSTTPRVAQTTQRNDAGKTLVVTVKNLPLYSGPAASYQILSQLAAGTTVTVLHTQGLWDHVVLSDSTQGWVGCQFLQAPAGAATEPGASQSSNGGQAPTQAIKGFHAAQDPTVVVTADVLFVRAGPDLHATILRRVHAGDRLRVRATKHGWDYVTLRDGSQGWVSAHYVR